MVDISDFIEPGDEEPADEGEPEDLAALRASLQALADAIASTNLAVINSVQGDAAGATSRVQASVAALKRFHDAFAVLQVDGDEADASEDEG